MTVIMGSLNLPFFYEEISFISEAAILKNSSSQPVLTLTYCNLFNTGNAKPVVFVVRKENNQSQKINDPL